MASRLSDESATEELVSILSLVRIRRIPSCWVKCYKRKLAEWLLAKMYAWNESQISPQISATNILLVVSELFKLLVRSEAVKQTRRSKSLLGSLLTRIPRGLKAARQAPWKTVRSVLCTRNPQRSITRSKRGSRNTGVFLQHVNGCCRSTNSEQSSERNNNLGRQLRDPEPGGNSVVRFSKLERGSASVEKIVEERREKVIVWDFLPADIHENILNRLEFKDIFRYKTLSKSCKKFIESDDFRQSRDAISEGSFTAINYYIKNKVWQCIGFDLHSKLWRALPPFSYLPPPDDELFKEYSVSGHGNLMCADVSKLPKKGELVVFNPLTRKTRKLPPLLHPRNPVLAHIWVNSAERSYKVIVAGSSTASDEHLSRKMEIFDSSTSEWKERCDLPGPAFGLNEHQAGVCLNGILFFISFLEGDSHRGVVAFDVENGKWLENLVCPIPFSSCSNTLQLVESDGKVYLFSEQERGQSVEHCIDELEFPNPKAGAMACQWRNVVQVRKSGGRGLFVYPEHTCVGFGKRKLCIFNALNRDGMVYDMRDGKQCEVLEPPPTDKKGDNFFSLNPASFILQPSFEISKHN